MKVTRKWLDLLIGLLGIALIAMGSIGSTPAAHADATDWTASAKNAASAFNGPDTVASVKASLFDLVDQTGPDPQAWSDIMRGVDDAIGAPGAENQWSIEIIRETEQRIIDSRIAEMIPAYIGYPTDDVWKEIPNVFGSEIRALGPNVALLKRGGKGFLWVRPGSAEYTQSDYTLGLQRNAWDKSSASVYIEPGSSQTMSVDLGYIPTSVKVGDTITVTPTFSSTSGAVVPWREDVIWTVECTSSAPRVTYGGRSYVVTSDDRDCGIIVDVGGSKAGYSPASESSFNVLFGHVIQVEPGTTPPVSKVFSKTYAPTVSGTTKVGKTLTAKVRSWKPKATSKAYQWLRNGTPIIGATKSKYKLTADDLGTVITVAVTGTRSGYTAVTRSNSSTKIVALGSLARGKAKATGSKHVGKTLTAKTWRWPSGDFHFQWYNGNTAIYGATAKTYTVTVADKGAKLRVKVWMTKVGYKQSSVRTSARTSKIKSGYLTKATPGITGVAKVGQALTVNAGLWGPAGVVLTYQWYQNGKKIAGATGTTYSLTSQNLGKSIKVRVTGRAVAYYTAWKDSASVKVTAADPVPPPTPSPSPTPPPVTPSPTPSPTAT